MQFVRGDLVRDHFLGSWQGLADGAPHAFEYALTASGCEAMYSSTDLKSVLAIVIPVFWFAFSALFKIYQRRSYSAIPIKYSSHSSHQSVITTEAQMVPSKAIVPEVYVFNILANDRVMAGQNEDCQIRGSDFL